MDRFHEMEVFVAVAESGGFSKAAQKLRLSPPAVTRAVAALETRLGIRLVYRTTRKLSLTEEGSRFFRSAQRLLEEIELAEREAAGETAAPHGHLTLTASVTFGRIVLSPAIRTFQRNHPAVTVSLLLLDRVVDLVGEGIDAGIRIGPLPDSSLIARKIGETKRILVASPDYLARRGEPKVPEDLLRHDVVVVTGLMPDREWRHQGQDAPRTIALLPRLETNDAATALEAAEAGEGVTIAPCYQVAQKLQRGQLRQVLADYAPPPVPIHFVYSQSRLVAPKVKVFGEQAIPALKQTLQRLSVLEPPTPGDPQAT